MILRTEIWSNRWMNKGDERRRARITLEGRGQVDLVKKAMAWGADWTQSVRDATEQYSSFISVVSV